MYFICSMELVNPFNHFGVELQFEGNHAIELNLNDPVPKVALKK
jgi:hypothetical protein